MMGLTSNLRVFLCLEAVDMRKSFNGLAATAEKLVADGLRNGALFVFTNKRRNRSERGTRCCILTCCDVPHWGIWIQSACGWTSRLICSPLRVRRA